VSVVDVNNDGKPDIIVATIDQNSVNVFLNSGNGTFFPRTNYSTGNGSNPRSLSVVDINSDSKPDIIVANYYGDNISIFLNYGNGTFISQNIYSTGNGSNPSSLSVVDINGDNKPDIIVAIPG
jgi:hypothetical protein